VHGGRVTDAAFSPDGKQVVTASLDERVARLWDATIRGATTQSLRDLQGHEDVVFSAVFSPDGQRIVTTSDDKTARIWEAATGRPLSILHGIQIESTVQPLVRMASRSSPSVLTGPNAFGMSRRNEN
jgi:WD40 repeat protein